MGASGDGPNLNPQPLHVVGKNKTLDCEEELKLNNFRLSEMKKQMKTMKDQIKRFSEILQKEMGDDIDIKDLLRMGHSSGWQSRAQMIMTLRIKLIAMRSKFLDPSHKMFYRGPFDPKHEFELKLLPQKQSTLYLRLLEEKKKRTLQFVNPVSFLQKELDDLSLMYRASQYRTKSLLVQVETMRKKVEESKEKSERDFKVIDAMMAHQSLFKMMIEPETFRLDPTLKRHKKFNPLEPPEVPDWARTKRSLIKSKEETLSLRNTLLSLVGKIDEINNKLMQSKKVDLENRLQMKSQNSSEAAGKKDKQSKDKKAKDQNDEAEKECKIVSQENRCLGQFLLSQVMSSKEDFTLFTDSVDIMAHEFLKDLQEVSENER